jgi:hypothetical protein
MKERIATGTWQNEYGTELQPLKSSNGVVRACQIAKDPQHLRPVTDILICYILALHAPTSNVFVHDQPIESASERERIKDTFTLPVKSQRIKLEAAGQGSPAIGAMPLVI